MTKQETSSVEHPHNSELDISSGTENQVKGAKDAYAKAIKLLIEIHNQGGKIDATQSSDRELVAEINDNMMKYCANMIFPVEKDGIYLGHLSALTQKAYLHGGFIPVDNPVLVAFLKCSDAFSTLCDDSVRSCLSNSEAFSRAAIEVAKVVSALCEDLLNMSDKVSDDYENLCHEINNYDDSSSYYVSSEEDDVDQDDPQVEDVANWTGPKGTWT